MYDALIIGGGPAGASCALWLERLGLNPLLADAKPTAGGLLNESPYRNDWIVTQPGVTGIDLSEGIGLALAAAGVPLLLGATAADLRRIPDGFEAVFNLHGGTSRTVAGRAIVIATGVVPRTGGLPAASGVLFGPGGHIARQDFSGRSVAILGGGDNAFENYAFVKKNGAAAAHIYARSVRARRAFVAAVDPADVRPGGYHVDPATKTVNGHPYDLLLVMYGWEPAPVFGGLPLGRDDRGYIKVDFTSCETSIPGVYAIGEAAARSYPSVVTAMADGVAAAVAIQRLLEPR